MAHGGDTVVLSQNCSLDTIGSATPQLSPLYCGGWGNPTCEGGGGMTHPCPSPVRAWPFANMGVVGALLSTQWGCGWAKGHTLTSWGYPRPYWVEGVGGLPHPNKEVMVGWPPTHFCPPPFFPLIFFLDFLFFCHKSISIKTLMAGTQKEQNW